MHIRDSLAWGAAAPRLGLVVSLQRVQGDEPATLRVAITSTSMESAERPSPVRLISLFKFSIMKDGKAMPDLQLAFVQTTTMAAGGAVERASGMVKVVQATPGTEY